MKFFQKFKINSDSQSVFIHITTNTNKCPNYETTLAKYTGKKSF